MPRSRRSLRAGRALRASRPTMKRLAKPFICRRIRLLARGESGECSPLRPRPQRKALGAAPCWAKYSCRWRAISERSRRVGNTSTKRSRATLRRSSAMAHSIISLCQRCAESTECFSSRLAARISRAIAWVRSSRAPASTVFTGSLRGRLRRLYPALHGTIDSAEGGHRAARSRRRHDLCVHDGRPAWLPPGDRLPAVGQGARRGGSAAPALLAWDGAARQPRGCCWVMQCTLPPPSTISRPATLTTVRSA